MNSLSPRITVEANPDAFTFTSPRATVRLNTYLCVTVEKGLPHRIVSIGQEVSGVAEVVKIELFKPDATSRLPYDKLKALEAFFRYAFAETNPLPLIIAVYLRPILVFRGIQAFDSIFNGYQRGVFEHVAQEAGADKVIFD